MLRGWIREAWLSKTTERRKKVMMKMDSQVTHDISDNMHVEKMK